ncbi:hypothetical protein FT637_16020 [Bacillus cereus]|uniref:hypothetical protein n=1 Tax=Bacillus cereus TaxID=1396 RepID=UPI00187978E7|nr:hypothetical protein [Bacillus cereus]MBE7104499.1 hypothetical protein [Bacillus cereus]
MAGLAVEAMSLSIWTPVNPAATQEKNKYYTFHGAVNSNIGDEILLFTSEKLNIQIVRKQYPYFL